MGVSVSGIKFILKGNFEPRLSAYTVAQLVVRVGALVDMVLYWGMTDSCWSWTSDVLKVFRAELPDRGTTAAGWRG